MASPLFATKPVDRLVADTEEESGQLKRAVGLLDLTALGIGAIIGTGIFVILGEAIGDAGPAIILSFVLAGITCAFSALAYAELASSIPVSGSAYTYAYATMGELAAWIIGWDLILEYGISVAAVAVGWGQYFNDLLDNFLGVTLPDSLANPPGEEGGKFNLPAVFLVLAVTALLIYGVRETARANTVMVFIKVGIVLLFIVLAVHRLRRREPVAVRARGDRRDGDRRFGDLLRLHRVRRDLDVGRGEQGPAEAPADRDPRRARRSAPSSTSWSRSTASAALPYKDLAGQEAPLAEVLRVARHGLGRDRDLDRRADRDHQRRADDPLRPDADHVRDVARRPGAARPGQDQPTRQTPVRITAGFGIFIALIAAFVPLSAIVELVNIGTLFAFVVTNIGVIVLRRTRPDLERGFRVPWVPVVPIIGALLAIYLMTRLEGATWWRFAIWMALGLLIYCVLRLPATRACARARSRTPKRRSSVPLVLQRPAGADRPRLDAVGARERLQARRRALTQ